MGAFNKPTLSYALQKLASVLRRDDGSFRLGAGSVCHTDSARAYKQLGVEDGPLFDGSFCNAKELKGLKLAHTNVEHKPPKPEFTKPFDVPVWQGFDDDWRLWSCVHKAEHVITPPLHPLHPPQPVKRRKNQRKDRKSQKTAENTMISQERVTYYYNYHYYYYDNDFDYDYNYNYDNYCYYNYYDY